MIFRYILAQIAPLGGGQMKLRGAYRGQGGGAPPEGGILGGMAEAL